MEEAFRLAKAGDMEAFARWMGKVELPLRRSLRRFARAVDVEVVVFQPQIAKAQIRGCARSHGFGKRNMSKTIRTCGKAGGLVW